MTKKLTKDVGISLLENVNPKNLNLKKSLNSNDVILEIIKLNKREISLTEKEFNKFNIKNSICHKKYGYKNENDYNVHISSKSNHNKILITLEPKVIYEITDTKLIPTPYNDATIAYQAILGDIYERFLIISESKLDISTDPKSISFSASINLQLLLLNFDKTLNDIKTNNDNEDIDFSFNLITYSFFIIKMINHISISFNNFLEDKTDTVDRMLEDLYNSVGKDLLFKFYTNCNKNKKNSSESCSDSKPTKLKWNNKINILTTFFFDAMHSSTSDTENLLECTRNDLKKMIINNFVDKNGNDLKESTVETYLNEYRDDKKAQEKNRICIPEYL